MKRTTLLTALLVAALCVPALAAQHPPVPDEQACPSDLKKFEGYPAFNPLVMDSKITFLQPGEYDFCRLMDNIYCSLGMIKNMNKNIAKFMDLLQCLTMDINGPVQLEADIPVGANGVLDSYELAVLAYVLNNPGHEMHEEVNTIWEANFHVFRDLVVEALAAATFSKSDDVFDKDIRALVHKMAPALTSSLTGILAGFATLGDELTNEALGELLYLLKDIGLEPPEGGIESIATGIPELGPNGDIDGDGYTNMEEYLYFVVQLGYNMDQYLAAAFSADQRPPSYDPDVTLTRKTGLVQIGDNVTLEAKMLYYYDMPLYVHWYKDGALIDGADALSLELINVQPEDSGVYSVTVGIELEEEDKAQAEVSAATVLTVSSDPLPVAGLAGLGVLAGALALAGARRFRRK